MEYKHNSLVDNPMVSVLVFTYNQEKMVGKTMESVLVQKTTFPIEIIIADDCSTDNTSAVCMDYFERNPQQIIYIRNDVNKGVIRNFHETITQYARGKYIACCAGDDWWTDEYKLQKQVDFLETNPDYGLVYTEASIFVQSTHKVLRKPMGKDCTLFKQIIVSNAIPALTAIYSRTDFLEYMEEIDPISLNFPGEDYPLWIWFSYRRKIFFLKEVTAMYRLQDESLSNTKSIRRKHEIEGERRGIKMFFYTKFNISDKDILYQINQKYYVDTMKTAPLIGDLKNIQERNKLFLDNKLYVMYLLSKLYAIGGNRKRLNNAVFFLERVCRNIGITNKYYK